jgi:hypothetical protein
MQDDQEIGLLQLACTKAVTYKNLGYLEIIQSFLDHGANVNEQERNGWTPLHIAVKAADVDLTRLLLLNGASVHLKDNLNESPLVLCFPEKEKSVEVIDLLLDYGLCHDSPELDAMIWDWKPEQHYQHFRPRYVLNWYYYYHFHSLIHFQDTGIMCRAMAALNDALVKQYIPRNANLPVLGEVTNSSEIVGTVVSVIYDLIQNRLPYRVA